MPVSTSNKKKVLQMLQVDNVIGDHRYSSPALEEEVVVIE